MKNWRWLLLIPLSAGLVVLLAGLRSWAALWPDGAERCFLQNRAAYERAAALAISCPPPEGDEMVRVLELDPPPGALRVELRRDGGVEFPMGGAGLGSQTSYWGVVYTAGDRPTGCLGAELDYTPDGTGWLWRETGGDNWSRAEFLRDHWYLYEMHF